MRLIYCLIALCLFSTTANAQDEKDERKSVAIKAKKKDVDSDTTGLKPKNITISTDGIRMNDTGKHPPEKAFEFEFAAVDVGINTLQDKTDYTSAAAQGFLNVPAGMKNSELFSLRTGKSWNVNVWPVMAKARVVNGKNQRMYLSTGVGLQMYNFRFSKDISYLNNTVPEVYEDSVKFSKNKLGFTYFSVPLAFTFKTRFTDDVWMVYGFGVTGGYRISSWTKQNSSLRGMQKNHDGFNFNDFNACVTGEIGIEGIFRIYASYQLTSLHSSALDQRPFCIGLRFGGV